ncbi:MAG: phage head-tail joining protein [Paracoccaceae bacterium]
MATLQELIAHRAALEEARYSGVREVRDASGESITYRSDAELARALATVNREIAAAQKGSPATILFETSKGV